MKRVLVVDDDPMILDMFRRVLHLLDIVADFADNGQEALDLLKCRTYDLLLIDLRMPGIDGVEIASVANQISSLTPILFMSGYRGGLKENQSFLPKPFTLNQLASKLDAKFTQLDIPEQ